MSTIHEWVQGIFPDVPPHLDEKTSEQVYYFKNSFTGAVSLCEFRKNEVRMLSSHKHFLCDHPFPSLPDCVRE